MLTALLYLTLWHNSTVKEYFPIWMALVTFMGVISHYMQVSQGNKCSNGIHVATLCFKDDISSHLCSVA
jgi:hypothetical protein